MLSVIYFQFQNMVATKKIHNKANFSSLCLFAILKKIICQKCKIYSTKINRLHR